jgi:hypothetical protein
MSCASSTVYIRQQGALAEDYPGEALSNCELNSLGPVSCCFDLLGHRLKRPMTRSRARMNAAVERSFANRRVLESLLWWLPTYVMNVVMFAYC